MWLMLGPTALLLTGLAVAFVLIRVAPGRAGQAIARVNGVEITREDTFAEARAQGLSEAALVGPELVATIVDRELLAQEAERRGLQRRAQYPGDRRRALAQLMATSLLRSLPAPAAPTADRVQAYINSHPERFADRRRLQLVQFSFASKGAPNLAGVSAEDARRALIAAGVRWNETNMAALDSDLPEPVRHALAAAQQGELVVLSGRGATTAVAVQAVEPAPLLGDEALRIAADDMVRAARERQASELISDLKKAAVIRQPFPIGTLGGPALNHGGH